MLMWPKWYNPGLRHPVGFEVIAYVARAAGIPAEQLKGEDRTKRIVLARHIVIKILRERGLSLPVIGRMVGGRDHSTIRYAIDTFDARIAHDAEMREIYRAARIYAKGCAA